MNFVFHVFHLLIGVRNNGKLGRKFMLKFLFGDLLRLFVRLFTFRLFLVVLVVRGVIIVFARTFRGFLMLLGSGSCLRRFLTFLGFFLLFT